MEIGTKPEGRNRVLAVDDEDSVLTTYRMILEQQGYAVTAVRTSKAAREVLSRQEFDLVLCDYALEEEHTGMEVIEYARRRYAAVRAALLTGYAVLDGAEEARQKGIAVLYKPIDIQDFLTTTAQLLRNTYEPREAERQKDKSVKTAELPNCGIETADSERQNRALGMTIRDGSIP